jgi:phosphoribosylaminoimidazole carboxylase PurE protein
MGLEANAAGHHPEIAPTAYVHPTATVIGRVCVGDRVFVGPHAVIRADEAGPDGTIEPIVISECANIQDCAIIHALGGTRVTIGPRTSIAHAAIIHGPCEIGAGCFVGFNSVVFRATLGDGAFVMHQALVEGASLPGGHVVPSGVRVACVEDVRQLTPTTTELTEFGARVVQANVQLVESALKRRQVEMLNDTRVSIVMGSKSDLDVMSEAARMLSQFGVPYEIRVVSAHRTPQKAHQFAATAKAKGIKVIIAGAGKAAHLAGVLASLTTVPVIGVPLPSSDLGGLDSLLSTVQMPGGIPVATTAIGKAGAKNAALLAIAILALGDDALDSRLAAFRESLRAEVEDTDREVRQSASA